MSTRSSTRSSTRYRGRHRGSRRKQLNPTVLGTGLVLPTTATLAVVAVTNGPTGLTLASSPMAIGGQADILAARADAAELAGTKALDTALRRGVEDRVARDTERTRIDAVTAENQRRAAQEATLATGDQVLDIAATGEPGTSGSADDPTTGADAGVDAAPAIPAAGPKAWVKPLNVSYVKSSSFGPRWGDFHKGQDLAVSVGTPVRALSSGVVKFTGWQGTYGLKVEVEFWDGTVAYYAHNSKILVKVGQKVTPGQPISLSGNTGNSTGPHVHLEIHPNGGGPVNPMPWLAMHGIRL